MSSQSGSSGTTHAGPTRICRQPITVSVVSWLTDPDEEWSPEKPAPNDSVEFQRTGYHAFAEYPEEEPRSRARLIALLLGAWLVVSLVVLGLLLAFRGPSGSNNSGNGAKASSSGSSAATTPSNQNTAIALPDGWLQRASDSQTDCAAHAYGEVASFLAKTRCDTVHRLLATTNQGGRTVVVASYKISFPSDEQAKKFNTLVAADGTGNVSDLLREGHRFEGGPDKLGNAAFASRRQGRFVYVAEAAFTSGSSSSDNSTLKSVAGQAIAQD
jgi:hypothetical protein